MSNMGGAMGGTGQSVVSACDVTNCSYNQAHQCTAGSIQVAFVDGMAHCATYAPSGGAVGIGGMGEVERAADPTMRGMMNDDTTLGA